MKNYFLILIILSCLIGLAHAQQIPKEQLEQNLLGNKLPLGIGAQTLQEYYQNVYKERQQEFQQTFMPSFDIDKTQLLEKLKESIPLEGKIDPKTYIVGPGDLLQIDVWSAVPFSYNVIVNPEGTVIIPTVGVVDVADKSLFEAKEAIKETVRTIYVKGKITASLIVPRIFSVTVSGIVNNPGTFYASAVQRVDQVIYQANLQSTVVTSKTSMLEEENRRLLQKGDVLKYYRTDELQNQPIAFSLRNIKLMRRNGDTLTVDLVRYYATGSTRFNPFLLDGDRIIVPNLNLEGNSIIISGAVRLEGKYEFIPGDSLSHIFEIAQDPTRYADLNNIDLYRTDSTSKTYHNEKIDYTNIIQGNAPDIALRPGDRIVVRKKSPRVAPNSITIKGEITRPGLYPITHSSTFLSTVIRAAGGFTKNASLADAKVIRFNEPIDELESNPDYSRLFDMRLSDMGIFDREYFNFEALLKRNMISVDFYKLFVEKDSTQDIILRDGDLVIVPKNQNTVLVLGQVPRPGHQQYVPGKNYKYYIERAGSLTNKAKKNNIRIIKAGSKNWIKPNKTKIQPGDTVWIPRKRDVEFDTYIEWIAKIAQILGSVGTVILLYRAYVK
ncbi:MAG: SLBB domain-containing protein [bacterium]|nr:MAG: SLBB domain-containing protein [bacterium]